MKGKRHPEKVVRKNNRCLRIVEIRYTPTPDANWRLRRAVDILLRSAATDLEGSVNAKKEEEPPKDSWPKRRRERMNLKAVERKPGRPKAIPEALIPKVLSLYHQGLGYRAVARELREEGISADWSTIRRIVKARTESEPRQE